MDATYQTVLFDTTGGPGIDLATINREFPWELLSCVERRYEDARWEFNQLQVRSAKKREKRGHPCPLSVKMLTVMSIALFGAAHPDLDAEAEEAEAEALPLPSNSSHAGRRGYPFLPMLKAFLLAPYLGLEQNAEQLASMLRMNLQYQLLCGFPGALPGARALRRFRQIMYTYGLWGDVKELLVLRNLELGVFELPKTIALDPTHLDGFASVKKEAKACKECPKGGRCPEHQRTCEMTGIVSKSNNYKLPGVKGTMVGLPESEILLDGIAGEGNRHDCSLLDDALMRLVGRYPFLKDRVERVLADRAYDSKASREQTREHLGANLVTPINERNRKEIQLADRGVEKIDKQGRPRCIAGHIMALAGRDRTREQYIWRCPVHAERYAREGLECSPECKSACAPTATEGRTFRVDRSLTPQISWEVPQHLASVEKEYDLRTSVERIIGRGKRGFQFERFFGRGRLALQGHLDRWVIAVNLLALVAWQIGNERLERSYRLAKAG